MPSKKMPEYQSYLLENLGDLYSSIKSLTPSDARTAQDSILEVRCSCEELFSIAKATNTESRIPVARALMALAARSVVEAAQLMARDEYEVTQWADVDLLEETTAAKKTRLIGEGKKRTKVA